ncbi:MAG: sensor histidine kinase [Planctomycetota bacterium]|jgi:signal transduction histidine kinase
MSSRSYDLPHPSLRAVSHDLAANFMLLEGSWRHLTRSVADSRDPKVDEAVAHVEACLAESKRFLRDLATLARTGRLDMEPTVVALTPVVEEVLFEQRDVLAEGNVQVDVQGPLPTVWCHRGRLKQLLANLLGNAVKHGCDPARRRITISSLEQSNPSQAPGAGLASFQVHDNGPGIAPEFHERVFLPGWQVPHTAVDGSGTGLMIVREIARYYGGEVRVDCGPERGTAFVVSLPIPKGVVADEPSQVEPPESLESEGETGSAHRLPGRDRSDDHGPRPHRAFAHRLERRGGR